MSHSYDPWDRNRNGRLGLSEAELAERWNVSPRTLQRRRCARLKPDFIRIGRSIIYPFDGIAGVEEEARVRTGDPE